MHDSTALRWTRRVVLTLLTIFTVLPLYVMVVSSVKPLKDVQGAFTWLPSHVTFQPFVDMWRTVPLGRYFVNSLVVSLSATVCSVLIAIITGYAVSRYRFPGRGTFMTAVLSTQMFPGILFLLPLFLIFVQIRNASGLQLTGSYAGLIITYMTFSLPFSIWMLTGYFASIPKELEEASMIDGTGRMGALFRVIIPVAKPGIIAVAVYAFITAWGEVLFASVLTSNDTRTLAIGLQAYSSQQDVYWNQLMAASVVVSLPVLIGFMFVQKHLITGLSSGAVK